MEHHQPRIAIVGAGLMGRWHLTYARRLGAQVVAIVDPDLARARALARRLGADAVAGPADWLEGCDVVHVCSPSGTHGEWIERALDSACHVVVEKPFSSTPEEAARLLELAKHRGRRVVPVHQFPFQRGYGRLKEHLESLGEMVDASYRVHTAGGGGASRERRRRVLLELIPHGISLFRGLGFTDSSVEAWQQGPSSSDELLLARTEADTSLSMSLSLRARPTLNELRVSGTRASALVDLFHGFCVFDRTPLGRRGKAVRPFARGLRVVTRATLNLGGRVLRWEPAYPGLRELLGHVYSSLESHQPVVDEEEILVAQRLMARAAENE